MNLCKSAILLSTLFTIQAQAEFVAIVIPPQGLYTESETDATLDVTQQIVTGTYSVTNAELIYSDVLISDEGCDVELEGDESSGTWTYYNNLACSDDDNFTLLATKGLSNTVTIFRNNTCDYLANEWLTAAHDGTGTGLLYWENSCSINNSIIRSLISSDDDVPAYYLDSIYIDIFSTGEGEENLEGEPLEPTLPDEGEGEGSVNPEFNLPYIQWVYDDIVVDHPFLESIDLSNLTYVLGDSVILRGMSNITSFDLSSLRNYNNVPLNVNVMGAMNATELDVSRLTFADIDISYTNISDISKFYRLQSGTIITNNDSETFFPQVTTFPNKNSSFCYGVRSGNITLSSSISQSNAESACNW
ncbi:hypothetical protein HGG78_17890 [Vibrio aestuarianus]|uniref:hypothetical protein n=1 Tax=Vibrio aestuarianus TaxID=28171 RepID=UPI001558FD1D|nr:hypothetical protein [Vibrio aestuarianus]NGZ15589.1 hypothetical protein [Vibrio aestuarianus]NKZ51737.1 hypothetical protein [Vibrio aestuarianus]